MSDTTPTAPEWYSDVPRSISKLVLAGSLLLVASLGGFSIWAFGAPLAAAIIAQGSFVDLDYAHIRFFQIQYLFANSQCQLVAGHRARLIVAHERPVENGHGAGEHSLHRLIRKRLCIVTPLYRHSFRAADIAK